MPPGFPAADACRILLAAGTTACVVMACGEAQGFESFLGQWTIRAQGSVRACMAAHKFLLFVFYCGCSSFSFLISESEWI